ncbi:hypothetical protein PENTCL1PPCAC_21317, partial [Pristionchus entomophagus]
CLLTSSRPMLRLAVFVALFYYSAALCPSGFELVRDGECYREISDLLNVDAKNGPSVASTECAALNAKPVIIRNQEDNDYWLGVSKKNHKKGNDYGFILLGLECSSSAHWQWTDGSKLDFIPEGSNPEFVSISSLSRVLLLKPRARRQEKGKGNRAKEKRSGASLACV